MKGNGKSASERLMERRQSRLTAKTDQKFLTHFAIQQ